MNGNKNGGKKMYKRKFNLSVRSIWSRKWENLGIEEFNAIDNEFWDKKGNEKNSFIRSE